MLGVARRNPEFRKLWIAQLVSQAGDWMSRMAILALIADLGGTEGLVGVGTLFGIELVIRMLPLAIFGPIAGPVADRLPRKVLMVVSDLLRAGVVLCFLLIDEPDELNLLYVLMVMQMAFAIFFYSARSGSVPNTVPKHELHEAYALSAATWSTMLAIGSATGGLLLVALGIAGVFWVDAATYVVSACFVLMVKLPPPPKHPAPFVIADVVLLRDIRRAWRHVRSLRITPILAAKACWGGAGGFLVALPIAGSEVFADADAWLGDRSAMFQAGAGAGGFAIAMLFCARGVGTGLGPIISRSLLGSSDQTLRGQIAVGFQVGALGYALFALSSNLPVAFFFVVLAHMGGSNLWVASTTFWQRRVDDAFRGRVFALEFLAMTICFSTGGVIAGEIYDATGSLRTMVWISCALVVAPGLAWAAWARKVPLRAHPET